MADSFRKLASRRLLHHLSPAVRTLAHSCKVIKPPTIWPENDSAASLETARQMAHTSEVLTELQAILAEIAALETARYVYVIANEERHLKPFATAVAAIDRGLERLRQLTASNPISSSGSAFSADSSMRKSPNASTRSMCTGLRDFTLKRKRPSLMPVGRSWTALLVHRNHEGKRAGATAALGRDTSSIVRGKLI